MPFKLVTCPETAHLELISYEDDPLGILVEECSRFAGDGALDCPRTCAERFDRRARARKELELPDADLLRVGDDTDPGIAVGLVGNDAEFDAELDNAIDAPLPG